MAATRQPCPELRRKPELPNPSLRPMRADPASLETKIDYRFSDAEMLGRALIHSSHAHEARRDPKTPLRDNQQLEFLGDSILGFLVAEALMQRFPGYREGELSRRKAHLVSAAHLHG